MFRNWRIKPFWFNFAVCNYSKNSIFQQHTLDLPGEFKGEVSGWYSGPGVWGGVFRYESSWSLNLGLQKKFLNDRLNAKLSVNDLFFESGWDGYSEFNGLYSVGFGRFDSRRVALSLTYNFGNENVKSRRRKTGLEEESNRLGESFFDDLELGARGMVPSLLQDSSSPLHPFFLS